MELLAAPEELIARADIALYLATQLAHPPTRTDHTRHGRRRVFVIVRTRRVHPLRRQRLLRARREPLDVTAANRFMAHTAVQDADEQTARSRGAITSPMIIATAPRPDRGCGAGRGASDVGGEERRSRLLPNGEAVQTTPVRSPGVG